MSALKDTTYALVRKDGKYGFIMAEDAIRGRLHILATMPYSQIVEITESGKQVQSLALNETKFKKKLTRLTRAK